MAGNPYVWDLTPLNNQAVDPDIAWQEGQLPGTVNGSARAMMSAEAGFLKDNNGTLTTGGSSNAYTVTSNIPFSGTPFSGVRLLLKANHTNTGAATLTVTPASGGGSAWPAKSIRVVSGATDNALIGGEIQSGGFYQFVYSTAANGGAGGWILLGRSIGAAWSNTRLAKTANYTVVNADKGKTLVLGGGAFFTLTINAASGYDADFAIVVHNEDTVRAKRISPSGVTSFLLFPNQTCTIFNSNSAWKVDPYQQRWRPEVGFIVYVDPVNGSSSNDGLASGSGNALATIQQAVDLVVKYVDLSLSNPATIQLADGTYTSGALITRPPEGATTWMTIIGNLTTPGNVIIEVGAGGTCIDAQDYAGVGLQGVRLQSSGSGSTGIHARQFCILDVGTIEFGTMSGGTHISINDNSILSIIANCAITGNAAIHASSTNNSLIAYNNTITISSAKTFTVFALASNNSVINGSATFSGSGSGTGSAGIRASSSGSYITTNITWPGTSGPQGSANGCADGSAATPFYSWEQDNDTGIYRIGANNFGGACNGTKVFDAKASGFASIGTNTNDNAATGFIGEYFESIVEAGSAVSLTTTTAANITQLTNLPAGDYDIVGAVAFNCGGTVQLMRCQLSTTSATFPSTVKGRSELPITPAAGDTLANLPIANIAQVRFSLSGTTTVYLVGRADFTTSTVTAYGWIAARRVR